MQLSHRAQCPAGESRSTSGSRLPNHGSCHLCFYIQTNDGWYVYTSSVELEHSWQQVHLYRSHVCTYEARGPKDVLTHHPNIRRDIKHGRESIFQEGFW